MHLFCYRRLSVECKTAHKDWIANFLECKIADKDWIAQFLECKTADKDWIAQFQDQCCTRTSTSTADKRCVQVSDISRFKIQSIY